MTDPYAYWRAKLAGDWELYIDEPQVGFWRRRHKNGSTVPIAIWIENGELRCIVERKIVDAWKVWGPFLQATTETAYRRKMSGGRYDDEYEAVSGGYTTEVTRAKPIGPPKRRPQNGDHTQKSTREETPQRRPGARP